MYEGAEFEKSRMDFSYPVNTSGSLKGHGNGDYVGTVMPMREPMRSTPVPVTMLPPMSTESMSRSVDAQKLERAEIAALERAKREGDKRLERDRDPQPYMDPQQQAQNQGQNQ